MRNGKISIGFGCVRADARASTASAEEVRFWTLIFDNDAVSHAFNTIIFDFEKANPGITVKVEQRSTDEQKAALRVAANSDQAPDAVPKPRIFVGACHLSNFAVYLSGAPTAGLAQATR